MDKLANESPKNPGRQHVDGRLKWYAEEEVRQVSHTKVEDEDVSCAPWLSRFTARQYN